MSANRTSEADVALQGGGGPKARDVIGHLCAVVVAGFFCFASYEKIMDVRQFAVEIGNYKMAWMNPQYVNIPAIILPWIELVAALALIFPKTRKGAALVIGGMLCFFIYAVYDAAIVRHLEISCGCFGKESGAAGWKTIGTDVLLIVGTLLSVTLPRSMACCGARRQDVESSTAAMAEPA